jgi:hypothetical protein
VCAIIKGTMLFADTGIIFCMLCLLPPVLSLGAASACFCSRPREKRSLASTPGTLLGACAGAAAIIPLMTWFRTPELTAGLAFAPLAAVRTARREEATRAGVVAAALLGLFYWKEPFTIRAGKLYAELGAYVPIQERWSPIARITVFSQPFGIPPTNPWGWGFGRVPPQGSVPRAVLARAGRQRRKPDHQSRR